jgi:PhnB protein
VALSISDFLPQYTFHVYTEGYGTVFPYMVVHQAEKFVDFLKNTFDAKEIGRTTLPGGRIANSRVRIGTTNFMVSEANGESLKPMPATYYIYVESVDRTLDKALANGAKKMFDPMDMPYRDRQAGITDPFGNIWWISNRLVNEAYD